MDKIFDADISKMNTFGMKVKTACLIEYDSIEELKEVLSSKDLPRPFFHIGGGSNLLFEKDFPGTILHSRIRDFHIKEIGDTVFAVAGSGLPWDEFCGRCASLGLWGPENLSHIPGECGAAAVQNIGAYGREVGELVESVECISTLDGSSKTFSAKECNYAYRESYFKNEGRGKFVVTRIRFSLTKKYSPLTSYGFMVERLTAKYGQETIANQGLSPMMVRETVVEIRKEKLPEPNDFGSAGSFFRNPYISAEKLAEISAMGFEKVPHFDLGDGSVKIPAAWLIDQCGWKGHRDANAGVWDKQALVIINASGNATPDEIISLEKRIVASVQTKFGITLIPEVEHV